MFGLVAAGRLGLATDGVEGALAKIHRVLPDAIRSRVEALESTLGVHDGARDDAADRGGAALLLADAIRRRRRIRGQTTARSSGDESLRELSPLGLVVHSGRWYLARARPRQRRPPHLPGRPHRRRGVHCGGGGRAAERLRRRRPRQALPRERAVAVGGRGAARPATRGGGRASAGDARRACARGRRNAPTDARQLARLDGRRARRPWLRLHRSGARTSSTRASRHLHAAFSNPHRAISAAVEYLDAGPYIGKYPNLLCTRTKGARFHGKTSAASSRCSRSRGRIGCARARTRTCVADDGVFCRRQAGRLTSGA